MTHNIITRYNRLKREMASSKHTLGILNEYGWSMAGVWQEYGKSMLRVWLRYALMMVLMMISGAMNEVWGQDPDYSGTYYIASNYIASKANKYDPATLTNNFYLCPTEGWAFYVSGNTVTGTNNGQPFITTHKRVSGDEAKYKWIVEKHTVEGVDYYTFKYSIDYVDGESTHHTRYMSYSRKISGAGVDRMRVHLEKTENPGDNELFRIVVEGAYLVISPKSTDADESDATHKTKYLTVNGGNKNTYQGESGKTGGPTNYTNTAGIIGTYWDITDVNAPFYLEDVITRPAIVYNSSNLIEITDQTGNATDIYYTTDGTTPTTSSTRYTGAFAPTDNVTTIKAVAVVGNEVSNVATFNIDSHQYLIQSVECTDFYMMPGDVSSGNTTVNTSSLFRSTMAWTFTSAAYEGGIQYYYIKNGENYLFRTGGNIYIKTNSDFEGATDKTGYMFSIGQWYDKVSMSFSEGYNIIPKGANFNVCIYKDGYAAGPPEVLANGKNSAVKNGEKTPVSYTRWNIIAYSAPGNVLPASLVTSDDSNPSLLKIENVGTAGQYMSSPATENVGTATLGNDALAWYIKEATSDSERKYYYIIHQSGKYLKFNKATTVNNIQSSVLDFVDYDASASDRYQFVFAKSTIDGAYYIVPKGLENVSQNNYYALYLDGTNPIKSNKERASDSYKWKFVPFCYNPVFAESEGNITLSCVTAGAEIHYTNDGTEPNESSSPYSSTNWESSNQVRIKAIGVIKEGGVVVSKSEVVTLLNKPDVTLEGGSQVYDGQQKRPEVKSVSVEGTSAPKYPDPETYNIAYANNINAGENTATVTITDLDANDRWYIWNVPTKTFTIEKKMLTVTADDKTVEYGHPAPEYTVTINGFENGEGRAVLTTIPSATCSTYTTSSAVGSTHDIVPSGGVDENYDFTYVNGTLTVAAAFVTLTANSGTETYNGTEQTVTGFTCSVDGLTFTGVSASGSGTNAGTYPVTFTGAIANATKDDTNQYVVTEIVNGTLTIDPVAATVTADDKTKTYGEADPALTVTITGMVNGESTDLITYTISRASGDNAGTYTITPTGEAAQGNYTVSYVSGTFTISQKDLTITANNHTIEYSNAPENNGVTYSGFITGEDEDTEGVFTGTLAYSYNSANDGSGTSYTTTIPKGTAYIIPSGLTATNYNITYNYGTLTVTAKSIGNGSSMASGFTLNFGDGGNIILLDGETTLTLTTDYTIGEVETTTSGKYSSKKVSGTGNYTGSFKIRNAIVNFQTDAERVEWSATFVAEPAGTDLADDTKGHKLPEGIRAYIIIDIDGEWAIPEPLDYIPEGIPVLLISDKAAGGFLVEDVSGKTSPVSTNMLKEVTASTPGYITDSGDPNYEKVHFDLRSIYLLSYNEFVHNMPGYLAKGKVYLDPTLPTPPPSPAPPRLRIKWDDVTGIEELQNDGNTETQDAAWYSLDGRRIDNSKFKIQNSKLPKGIYITNGRKVIIK